MKTLVTAALPYANGPIHVGHLYEYVCTDIIVRGLKLNGKDALYCCASDAHGAPIEINAHKQGITPKELVERYTGEHQDDFKQFNIHFDSYYTTDSDENRKLSEYLFNRLKEEGLIYEKPLLLQYDPEAKRFLPDRYVKGECPKCGAKDQYGDVCEKCNATYNPTELKNAYSVISGAKPIQKESTHYFFKLSSMSAFLKEWLTSGAVQKEVANQVLRWVENGLEDWCISRDAPYYGFKIPGSNKYFYVWLDAPLGYISSYGKLNGISEAADNFKLWDGSEVIHHIGKDIITFHLLFWPAVLKAAGHRVPDKVLVHGFVNINSEKMSKSRGTFITAKDYLAKYPAEALRWYYVRNYTPGLHDINLDAQDVQTRFNNELVANIANFCYRTESLLARIGEGKTSAENDETIAIEVETARQAVLDSYASLDIRGASDNILKLGDIGNRYFQQTKPWELAKENQKEAVKVLTTAAGIARDLAILIEPILPDYATKIAEHLNIKLNHEDLGKPLTNHTLGAPSIILKKIEGVSFEQEPTPELRVAKVLEAKVHPQADKLFVLQLDLGSLGKRQIVAGINGHYKPEEITGKHIIIAFNLKPAKLRGVESNGMLLAGEENGKVRVLETKAVPGTAVLEGRGQLDIEKFGKLDLQVIKGVPCFDGKPLKAGIEPVTIQDIFNSRIR
ncbi:MAG: methionine--tRNA ligase [Candidatus Woesearchaeota archaeon]